MQFIVIERGSDRVIGCPVPNHCTNCAHPLFCVVSLYQAIPPQPVFFQIYFWSEP